MFDNKGFLVGMEMATRLSSIVLQLNEEEAEGFMKAIHDWYNFVENEVPADWMVAYLPKEMIN